MSVRFQYAGDKDISAGRSGGASIFSLPGGVSFPAAGTILETLTGQPYPIAEGGAPVSPNGTNYPSQTADVYRKADGSGGNYLDWASAFNIQYYAYGEVIDSEDGDVYVTINGTNYDVGNYGNTWYHDGAGSFYADGYSNYDSYGTYITSTIGITTYVNVLGTNYVSGSYDETFYSDGSGGYYSTFGNYSYTSNGTFIVSQNNQTEVPSTSGNYFDNGTATDYYHDGAGSWYSGVAGSYYSYGTFITNYAGTDYYWDGSGGYYS